MTELREKYLQVLMQEVDECPLPAASHSLYLVIDGVHGVQRRQLANFPRSESVTGFTILPRSSAFGD